MSNILGNFLAGQQAGQQQHQYRQEQSKLAQLRELAPQVLAGDPAAYGQAAALDLDQANKLQTGRDGQLRRFGGFIKFIDEAKASGDPRRLSAAMREAAPYLQQLGAPAFDPNAPWTPEYDAGWEALKAQYEGAMAGGGGGTLQSQKIGDDGFIYNAFRDGRMVNTGVKADRQMWFRDHPGMDPQLVGKDGSVQTVGQAGAPQAPAAQQPGAPQRSDMEADIELANSMIAAGIPEAQVDAFLAQRGQRAPAPAPAVAPGSFGTPAGGSLARPSPAQEAAATERARLQAQAEYLPQELAMRGQAAVDQAVGIERGKSELEQQQAATGRQRDAGTALELLGEAERLLPQATGGRVAAVGDAVAGAFGHATSGAQANAALATIAGQLTSKMPRMEGPQSDRDVQMYKEMAGDLANANLPVETRLAALEQIRRLQSKYAGGQQRQQRPIMVHSPADYNALPAGALYTAPDGSTRRKK